jgi:riboflavin biosynthesis pyrimidine reductase
VEGQVPEVAAWLSALYGLQTLPVGGVLHVTSAVRCDDGLLRVLAIGPEAPSSEGDFFVLNLARARSDAIITTGAIMRAEPDLQLSLAGPHAAALAAYRREVLGKATPPVCVILTRDGRLPRLHPLWKDGTPKLILTGPEYAQALVTELPGDAEVVGLPGLNARSACALLQARGAALVSIEAGPSTNAALYEPPACVDELSLSLFEGSGGALGGALSPQLTAGMVCVSETTRDEQSGPWRYQRWLRA